MSNIFQNFDWYPSFKEIWIIIQLSFHIMTISVLHLLANDIHLILLYRHPEIANKNTKY